MSLLSIIALAGSYTRSAKACKIPDFQYVVAFVVSWDILVAGGFILMWLIYLMF